MGTPEGRGKLPSLHYDEDEEDGDQTALISTQDVRARAKASAASQPYFIVIAGSGVGEMHRVADGPVVIGRSSGCHIRVTDDGVSRKHARVELAGEEVRIVDLESANGTFVNGDRVDQHTLADGDKIQVGSTTILKFTYHDAQDEEFQRNLLEAARRDGLTKALSKSYFFNRLDREIAFAERHGSPLCLLMIDLDHFKAINDTYGHPAGDAVLAAMAELIQGSIRSEDLFARYGGEEFALMCRGVEAEHAAALGERLRSAIEQMRFEEIDRPVTASVGVAQFEPGQTVDQLIEAADRRLYDAKNGGRNRVVWQD